MNVLIIDWRKKTSHWDWFLLQESLSIMSLGYDFPIAEWADFYHTYKTTNEV